MAQMSEFDRHQLILHTLKSRPFATVRDLEAMMDASPATIRRDMAKLHNEGRIRKVFGGVAATEGESADRLAARPFMENQSLGVAAKSAIAEAAEKLVHDGENLIIHGGTTCFLFAQRLAFRNVRIFTNSMPLAAALAQQGTCHLTLAGGDLHREPGILFAPNSTAPEFYASKFFVGAQAIAAAGTMESNPLIVRETEQLLARADEVVVLADSRKFAMRTRHTVIPLSRIGTLITDDAIAPDDLSMLQDAGVKVIVAGPGGEAPSP